MSVKAPPKRSLMSTDGQGSGVKNNTTPVILVLKPWLFSTCAHPPRTCRNTFHATNFNGSLASACAGGRPGVTRGALVEPTGQKQESPRQGLAVWPWRCKSRHSPKTGAVHPMARLSDWLQSATELATSTEGHRAGPPMRAGGDRRGSALARALRRAEKLESKTRNRQSELNRAQKHAAPAENGQPEKSPRSGATRVCPEQLGGWRAAALACRARAIFSAGPPAEQPRGQEHGLANCYLPTQITQLTGHRRRLEQRPGLLSKSRRHCPRCPTSKSSSKLHSDARTPAHKRLTNSNCELTKFNFNFETATVMDPSNLTHNVTDSAKSKDWRRDPRSADATAAWPRSA